MSVPVPPGEPTEEVTVTLQRKEFIALVRSAAMASELIAMMDGEDEAIRLAYTATKVVNQISPEWAAANPLPAEAIEYAQRLEKP